MCAKLILLQAFIIPEAKQFLKRCWHSRGIHGWRQEVLRSTFQKGQATEISSLSRVFLDSVYLSGSTQQHASSAAARRAITLWEQTHPSVKPFTLSEVGKLVIQYLKNLLQPGLIFGLPRDIFDRLSSFHPIHCELPLSVKDLVDVWIGASETAYAAQSNTMFFEVERTRPESRDLVDPAHISKNVNSVTIHLLQRDADSVSSRSASATR